MCGSVTGTGVRLPGAPLTHDPRIARRDHRRVEVEKLREFLAANGMPTGDLDAWVARAA